ncbi:hypothetical protein SAMN06297387_1325 [Streptomyces zhaozhouensis]|uniref:Uncharacterized protein n=1 Tax=Streptomyces zhaozhouensis TaxID=1300267 RepID=A0A286E9F2_9ACTN|nr:bacteriocin fulvocin C-related protein [Streptomyces zhaozhouensis]SOD67555.1 hypothetical protein SAMN06297387_1325 [Streptomyces zhaozhouensis]
MLPLEHPEVVGWARARRRAPTLFAVDPGGEAVGAWSGAAMATRLGWRLGLRRSVRVLGALGRLRREARGRPEPVRPGAGGRWRSGARLWREARGRPEPVRPGAGGRWRSGARLWWVVGGLGVAAGIVLAGRTPAFAERSCAAARAWVAERGAAAPTRFAEIIRYPMTYRRALYTALTPELKSRFWLDHLRSYAETRPAFSPEQAGVHHGVLLLASEPRHFDAGRQPIRRARELRESAEAAFGREAARELIGSLGPAVPGSAPVSVRLAARPTGECAEGSDWCDAGFGCGRRAPDCVFRDGCGDLGFYVCDGLCLVA